MNWILKTVSKVVLLLAVVSLCVLPFNAQSALAAKATPIYFGYPTATCSELIGNAPSKKAVCEIESVSYFNTTASKFCEPCE